ncbi:helix-turn-helix transcriptional regulator [Streptosporangium sandarakinum]|uniref:helix-turn-helix transcriptional regulator n=1 Tax=Streptosporangium sandarakinum TaxID=1260955 RepID=UPI0037B20633
MSHTPALDTSARLLKLLSLLWSRRDWPGAELAARLGVTRRTVRRDVERLRLLGYPVSATSGVAGGYRLEAGATLPPLLLDDEEAVAVAIGLRLAAGGAVTGLEETSVRALAKLEQLLPARLRHRLTALHAATVHLPGRAAAVDSAALSALAGACRDRERLRFAYRDASGVPSDRTVEPYRLVHAGQRWYLVALDLVRDDWRTFRVDRIGAPRPTGARFTPREPPDAAAFVAASVSTGPYAFTARVRLAAPADAVAGHVPPTVGVLEDLTDGTCLLTTGSDSLDALVAHLILIGVEFEVLDPPELADRVRATAQRLTRAACLTGPGPVAEGCTYKGQ